MRSTATLLSFFFFLPLLFAQLPIPPSPDMGDVDLDERSEGSWIAVEGTITSLAPNGFTLQHDDGTVEVSHQGELMNDVRFQQGQQVTVYGWVDEDLFKDKVIKAKAISYEGEAGARTVISEADMKDISGGSQGPGTIVHGTVTRISGRTLTLNDGEGRIMIDTRSMAYDPTQATGDEQVEVGDIVTAHGNITNEFWTVRTLRAKAVDVVKLEAPEERVAAPDGEDR